MHGGPLGYVIAEDFCVISGRCPNLENFGEIPSLVSQEVSQHSGQHQRTRTTFNRGRSQRLDGTKIPPIVQKTPKSGVLQFQDAFYQSMMEIQCYYHSADALQILSIPVLKLRAKNGIQISSQSFIKHTGQFESEKFSASVAGRNISFYMQNVNTLRTTIPLDRAPMITGFLALDAEFGRWGATETRAALSERIPCCLCTGA